MNFHKNELKIFLTFFLIYFIFAVWVGYYENSLFDLIKAIVDEGRLEIDSYFNDTADRSLYKGHYYSNKVIGAPIQAIPIYASWKFIYHNFFPQSFINSDAQSSDKIIVSEGNNAEIWWWRNLNFLTRTSMIFITSLTSSLFSALTLLLLYKISKHFIKGEKNKFLLVTVYGLGTLAFPFATAFWSTSIGTFFSFLSFYILFKTKISSSYNKIIFAGLASGFAIITENFSILVSLFLIFYILTYSRSKKTIFAFLIANLLAISPLLVYNFYIFGIPFESIYKYYDPITVRYYQSWLLNRETLGFNFSFEPFRILRLLFFPFVGLFFYYPILLLSFYGLIKMDKKYKVEKFLILLVFLSMIILISMFRYWWGSSFGARFLLVVLPFFVLPVIYSFEKVSLKIVSILLIISVFINLLSTVGWGVVISSVWTYCCDMDLEYLNKINTFEILINPLFEKNSFDFLEYGPRSKIIESLLVKDYIFDIRDARYFAKLEEPRVFDIKLFTLNPFGFGYMKVSFVSTLFVIIMIILIWRKRSIEFILRYRYLFVIICLLSLFYFFNIKNIAYGKHWFSQEFVNGMSYRWMSDNATLNIYSPEQEKVKLQLNFWNFYKNRTMEIYLNDELVSRFDVRVNESSIFYTPIIELQKGENIIRFISKEGCDVPNEIGVWEKDYRCLSLQFWDIRKMAIDDLIKAGFIYESNWYYEEKDNKQTFRWMLNNATISIYSEKDQQMDLKVDVMSYYKNRTMEVYLNDKLIESFNVMSTWSNKIIKVKLNIGENIIRFHSLEGCDIPAKIENSTDERCLSFVFKNIIIKK